MGIMLINCPMTRWFATCWDIVEETSVTFSSSNSPMALLQNDCDTNKQQSGTLIYESFRLFCEILFFLVYSDSLNLFD